MILRRAILPQTRLALIGIASFWAGYVVLVTLRAAFLHFPDMGAMFLRRMLVALVGVVLACGLHLLLTRFRPASLVGRIGVALAAALPAAAPFTLFNYVVFYLWQPFGKAGADLQNWDARTVAAYVISEGLINWYVVFAAWAAIDMALLYAVEVREGERRASALREQARIAELRALRFQLDPHFLFNALNSLSTLVMRTGDRDAEQMVDRLSAFFRASLSADASGDVTLSDELRAQRLYLEIEHTRFPDRLRASVDLEAGLERALVPGLILQPLVENAVKYGVGRSTRPVDVRVTGAMSDTGGLLLAVDDDGEAAAPGGRDGGHGIGLANVAARLAARFGTAASFSHGPKPGGGYRAELRLPLNLG